MKLAAVVAIIVAGFLWQGAYEAGRMYFDLRKASSSSSSGLARGFAWITLGAIVWALAAMVLAARWLG